MEHKGPKNIFLNCFNVDSDVTMLALPLPVLLGVRERLMGVCAHVTPCVCVFGEMESSNETIHYNLGLGHIV